MLTVLTSSGPRLAKRWTAGADKPLAYENAKHFSVREHPVNNIFELSALLKLLESDPKSCIVRGKFTGPDAGRTLRRLECFTDVASHFCYIDVDGFKPDGVDPVADPVSAIEQYIASSLPDSFQGVTYHWQLSGSAGHPSAGGALKAHLAFWLSSAISCSAMEAWAADVGPAVDRSVFRPVQVNYTAAPVFDPDVADPVRVRSGLVEGWSGDTVDLVLPAGGAAVAGARVPRSDMVDPSEKEGIVGDFCRAFEIEEVVERWLGDVFTFDTDTRLTWLLGGGAGGGAGVTDNRQGIFNTHNTDPFGGRAANKWDLVRYYEFGHLDSGLSDSERALLGVIGLPSQEAMMSWARDLLDPSQSYKTAIVECADENRLRAIAAQIAGERLLDPIAKELLASLWQARCRVLTGVKPSIAVVRGLMAGSRVTVVGGGDAPEWMAGWCYVTAQTRFFKIDTKERITSDAFDKLYSRELPPDNAGRCPPASKVACDAFRMPTVYETMYLPSAGEIFTVDGKQFANEYQHGSAPVGVVDDAAFAVLNRHFGLMVPDPTYRKTLLQWCSWVVQNPGRKILWSVFIKGIEGDGKSAIGRLLGQAMGQDNVNIISPETLAASSFTDWAAGCCLNVLEEIKMQGHNRHDVYNKIKPLITNARIEIHPKGRPAKTVVNTVNYLGFSNHADALPLDEHDRRQFVLFTPHKTGGELTNAITSLGVSVDQYWDQLWDVIKNKPEACRGFFDHIDLTDFDPNSRAPASEFKELVVSYSEINDSLGVAKQLIAQGGDGFGPEIVASDRLSAALFELDVHLKTVQLGKFLANMGFVRAQPAIVKWRGRAHRVWHKAEKGILTNAEIREKLDLTVTSDFLD